MRKFYSFLLALLLTSLMTVSFSEVKAIGVKKSATLSSNHSIALTPAAPTNVNASSITSNSMLISWDDNSGGTATYNIYVNGGPNMGTSGNVKKVGVPVGATSLLITGLTPVTYYWIIVESVDGTGQNWSSLVGTPFRTIANKPLAPSKPVFTNAQTAFTTAMFYWTTPPDPVNRYYIQRSSDGGKTWSDIGRYDTPFKTDFIDNNLVEGVLYTYRVRSEDTNYGGGFSDWSDAVSIQMLKHTFPTAPFGLTATKNATDPQTMVDLAWVLGPQDNLTNNPVSMEIWRSAISATAGFIQVNGNANLYPSTYTDSKLKPKTKYWYYVRARNEISSSPNSNVVMVTTAGPPLAPSSLTATPSVDALKNSIITLNWGDMSDDEWAYEVQRSTGDSLNFATIATLSPVVTAADYKPYVNIPLTEGVTYYYRMRATNKYGASAWTPAKSATSIVTKAPNAPYFLKATASAQNEVTLAWNDDSNNETKFEIERSTDDKAYAKVGEVLSNVVTYVDKSLADSTLYYYRVRAVNSLGNSAYATASVRTLKKKVELTGILRDEALVVYPNPTFNSVRISMPESNANEAATIRVVDKNNREILRKISTISAAGELNLDLSYMPEGTYTINIVTATTSISKRVVKN